jgi:hypothetical protein
MAKSLYKIVHLADTRALYEGVLKGIDEDSAAHSLLKAAMEACSEKMEDCAKAEVADNLAKRAQQIGEERRTAKLVPTNASAVTPNRPGIVAVPRAGQPIPVSAAPELERIFGLADLNSLD